MSDPEKQVVEVQQPPNVTITKTETDDGTTKTEVEITPQLKDKWWLVGDNKGNGSVSTTLLVVAFVVTTISYVLNMFNIPWLRPFDVAAVGVYTVPIISLYFGRTWTKSKE